MLTDNKHVTVLKVSKMQENVTVLSLDESDMDLVTIYRLPGERLGMGLKFQGGCHVSECITHLFIQSITEESPASRSTCKWGCLQEGDMILQIQGRDVSTMTRLDCVSVLRDAPVALNMLVRHLSECKQIAPPPVPTRTRLEIRLSPQIARALKLSRGKSPTLLENPPVAADVYTDLIAEEEQMMMEYESDDTGSSVSTVVDHVCEKNESKANGFNGFESVIENGFVKSCPSQQGFVLQERKKFEKMLKSDVATKPRLKYPPKKPCIPPPPVPSPRQKPPPPIPPRSKTTKISSQQNDEQKSTTGERLLAVQSWLEDFVLTDNSNRTPAQGEETSFISASEPEMESDVIQPVFVDSCSVEVAQPEPDNTSLPPDIPLPQVAMEINNKTNDTEHLLIDFTEDLSNKPSRLPPDGHEFPPTFNDEEIDLITKTPTSTDNSSLSSENVIIFQEAYSNGTSELIIFEEEEEDEDNIPYTHQQPPKYPPPPPIEEKRQDLATSNLKPRKVNEKTSLQEKIAMFSQTNESPKSTSQNGDLKPFNTLPRRLEKTQTGIQQMAWSSETDTKVSFVKQNSSDNKSWYSLLESRKEQVSKLRGLVIPDKQKTVTNVIPMPTIIKTNENNNNSKLTKFGSLPRNFDSKKDDNSNTQDTVVDGISSLSIPPWKDVSNFPKYSPAFKRKALTVLQREPRTRSATAPQLQFSSQENAPSVTVTKLPIHPVILKDETEDKDSVISSSGSNFSQSLSPPVSPFQTSQTEDEDMVEEYVVIRIADPTTEEVKRESKNKEPLVRKSSIEALNRRNVLEHAKHSRGASVTEDKEENESKNPPQVIQTLEIKNKSANENHIQAPLTYIHARSHSDIIKKSSFTSIEKQQLVRQDKKGVKTFREIAEQWEKKSQDDTTFPKEVQTRRKSLPAAAFNIQATSEAPGVRDRAFSFVQNVNTSHNVVSTSQRNGNKNSSASVGDLLKMFEQRKQEVNEIINSNGKSKETRQTYHARMSSQDSTASESEVLTFGHYGSVNSLSSITHDNQYGSISSLASSTSLISPQELQQLLDDANQSLEESGTPQHEIYVVVLHREIAGGSIGITLAGGADYEAKEITVHKVINGSLADRDGRIQKGDRVISINGKNVKGITHKEALNLLKAPRPECVLVLSRNTSLEEKRASVTVDNNPKIKVFKKQNRNWFTAELVKDGAGLGISLDGGKDSPSGDKPLTIKKIFLGGSAEKCKLLKIGDEIISINNVDVTSMTRIEAWNLIKKLPEGKVGVTFRKG